MPTTARLAWCTAKRRTLPQGANVPYRREVGRRGADPPTCRTGKYGRRTHSLPTRQSTANSRRSRTYLHCRHRPLAGRAVTCCDWLMRLTLRFRSIAGTRNCPAPPGSSPAGRCPMTTAAPSTALATIQPAFTDAERLALAGFLAGYRGLTREAYTLDLRQFTTWCRARSLALFAVRRAEIESFARELEARGRARATVTRRLCTIAGFYRYAVEEELLVHSPAAYVRRPRVDYESHAVALDRNERRATSPGRAWPATRSQHPTSPCGTLRRSCSAFRCTPARRGARRRAGVRQRRLHLL